MKVLVLYDSKTGNTEKMAMAITEGLKETGNSADIKKIGQPFPLNVVVSYDGIVVGSPAIYADATRDMREFLQQLKDYAKIRNLKLKGKAGIFGSYGYDGAWFLENRIKGYLEDLGYDVFPEVCVKVDTQIKADKGKIQDECKAWTIKYSKFLGKKD